MTTNAKQQIAVIERIVRSTAYARNGNAHRPTVYYAWVVKVDGIDYGIFARRRDAQNALPDLVAEHAERKSRRATSATEVTL